MKVGQPRGTFQEFAERFNVQFHFSAEQESQFDEGKPVVLSASQLDKLTEQVSMQEGLGPFLETNAKLVAPVCMSLYVINDATWALMERKPWDKDKMLAMTTMPYCFWDHNEEYASNPKAVKRWDLGSNRIAFKGKPLTLSIEGDGGDFSGFIERSMLTMRKFGMPEMNNKQIPNYVFKQIGIMARLGKAKVRIHPEPTDEFDYDYSESARVFHDHGIQLEIPGDDVSLTIEDGKPSKLRGVVHLLVGKHEGSEEKSLLTLLADVWFWAFHRLMEAEG